MKIAVDRDRCIGIGICESISEKYFEVGDDGGMILLRKSVDGADVDDIEEAVRSCPAKALELEKEDT